MIYFRLIWKHKKPLHSKQKTTIRTLKMRHSNCGTETHSVAFLSEYSLCEINIYIFGATVDSKDGRLFSSLYASLKLLLLIVRSSSARQARVPLYRDGH
jgi:hypothetical protein